MVALFLIWGIYFLLTSIYFVLRLGLSVEVNSAVAHPGQLRLKIGAGTKKSGESDFHHVGDQTCTGTCYLTFSPAVQIAPESR